MTVPEYEANEEAAVTMLVLFPALLWCVYYFLYDATPNEIYTGAGFRVDKTRVIYSLWQAS